MTDHEETMAGNCNTWKMKNQIAPCHLNIIIDTGYLTGKLSYLN